LKNNLVVNHMKETATAQALRVLPLKHTPLPVFKNIFRDAYHFGLRKFSEEHLSNGRLTDNRFVRYLMIDGVLMVKSRNGSASALLNASSH